jgi:hypothetical protein
VEKRRLDAYLLTGMGASSQEAGQWVFRLPDLEFTRAPLIL